MAEPHEGSVEKTVRAIRDATGMNIQGAMEYLASELGFPRVNDHPFSGWRRFMAWKSDNNIDFSHAIGPHVITLLKVMAIRFRSQRND